MNIRDATDKDMKAIWEIWMQDHVIKYMSFEKMSLSEFESLFRYFKETSQIYVMTKLQNDKAEKIIAVIRLGFGEGNRSHVVGFYSLGLHKDYLNKTYGYRIHEQVIEYVKTMPNVKRIELSQSEGNRVAFRLVEKFGFKLEAIFPGWLHEKLYERYMALIVDNSILSNIANAELIFTPSQNLHVYSGHPVPIEYTITRGPSVIKHIAFLTIVLKSSDDLNHAADFMEDVAKQLAQEGIKKIEVFTHDSRVLTLLAMLGYRYRGRKIASLKIQNKYYDEIGADLAIK